MFTSAPTARGNTLLRLKAVLPALHGFVSFFIRPLLPANGKAAIWQKSGQLPSGFKRLYRFPPPGYKNSQTSRSSSELLRHTLNQEKSQKS